MNEKSHSAEAGRIIGTIHGVITWAILFSMVFLRGYLAQQNTWQPVLPVIGMAIVGLMLVIGIERSAAEFVIRRSGGVTRKLVAEAAIGAVGGAVLDVILEMVRARPDSQVIDVALGFIWMMMMGSVFGIAIPVVVSLARDSAQKNKAD